MGTNWTWICFVFYDLVEPMTFNPTAWQRQRVTPLCGDVQCEDISRLKQVETSKFHIKFLQETPEISRDTVTR